MGEGVVAASCGGVGKSHSRGDAVLEVEVDIQVFGRPVVDHLDNGVAAIKSGRNPQKKQNIFPMSIFKNRKSSNSALLHFKSNLIFYLRDISVIAINSFNSVTFAYL